MTDAPSRQDIAALAAQAGLMLPDAYLDELVSAYAHVRTMIAAMPVNRPRSDEPAHIFEPTRFLPSGA